MANLVHHSATPMASAVRPSERGPGARARKPHSRSPVTGNLGVTALYTAATWSWGQLKDASLFMHKDAARVFAVTNAVMRIAALFGSRVPSLPCGLIQRHVLLDTALQRANVRQVIELAAGLSRRGAAFSEDATVYYTEVDQPLVIARKQELLRRSPAGAAVLARPNLRFIAQDVVAKPLYKLPVTPGAPLAVIAEGLFVYLNPAQQLRVATQVQRLIARAGSGTFLLDFVPWSEQPRPSRVGRWLDAMLQRVTRSGGFVRDERTRTDIAAMLRAAGFRRVALLEPGDAAAAPATAPMPFLDRPTQQLVFVAEY